MKMKQSLNIYFQNIENCSVVFQNPVRYGQWNIVLLYVWYSYSMRSEKLDENAKLTIDLLFLSNSQSSFKPEHAQRQAAI